MAELNIDRSERPGILKEIDEGAIDLVFQAMQEDIYSFPIKSFIRESISNGLDAIIERQIFDDIHHGQPVKKFYRQQQEGKLLKDSEYDKNYYNEKHLSDDNVVQVRYVTDTPRDSIEIIDYGVGLGEKRLKGFFKLGYSSKRNMKNVIGKFGFGAKVGLATGVDYFIMNTVYNGYRTSFMIFKHDYEAITIKSKTGKREIWTVKMSNGTVHEKSIFWSKTNEKNSVQIVLEVKKHNKKAFINAVKDQFQYFNGRVRFTYDDMDNYAQVDALNETPLYESDTLLIPKYSTYTTPHILVDNIAYGIISWDELELEKRRGKVAIKVKATDVDITQSRESLKWTEKTKKVILKSIRKAETEASEYISSLIDITAEDNIFAINDTYGGLSGDDPVSSIFSKFLSKYNIKPKFKIDYHSLPKMKVPMDTRLFETLFYDFKVRRIKLDHTASGTKIRTTIIDSFEGIRKSKIVYERKGHLGPKLAEHLLNHEFDVGELIYIRPRVDRMKTRVSIQDKDLQVTELNSYVYSLLDKYGDLNLDDYEAEYI
ncbi:hypothetical protein LCGC14_1958970, partial [marine sediment metagenome]